jgi:hypothetical protein
MIGQFSYFIMEDGEISGNTVSNENGATVVVGNSRATFTMIGGHIKNNISTSGFTSASGGVAVSNANGLFQMQGGVIENNRRAVTNPNDPNNGIPADVYADTTIINRITLSGGAKIGTLTLNAFRANERSGIAFNNFTGSIGSINLRSNTSTFPNVHNWWRDINIITGANENTLSYNIGMGYFMNNGTNTIATEMQPIEDTHHFALNGSNITVVAGPLSDATDNVTVEKDELITAPFEQSSLLSENDADETDDSGSLNKNESLDMIPKEEDDCA